MKIKILKLILLLLICQFLFPGEYEPNWESLNSHDIPEWLLDAKFGIYGHWGIYSVPAFQTEWYGRLMYDKYTRHDKVFNHHIKKYGKQSDFGYKDFIPMWKAEKFDSDEWAEVISKSGAKYAGLTAVHHDGFCLWDSKYTRWNSAKMGPKQNLYGDLVASLRNTDPELKILTCFHHLRTYGWFFTRDKDLYEQGNQEGWDIFNPEYADFYRNSKIESQQKFMTEWQNKVVEVIDNYKPDVIWFDGGGFRSKDNEKYTLDVLSYFYNTEAKKNSPVEVINKKTNFDPEFGLKNYEKGGNRPPKVDKYWVDDLNIAKKAWGYLENISYRSVNEIIDGLVDRVSRGGGLMLSISPKPDGTIPEEQKHILLEIGKWLKLNGEGIYGTRKWKIETEGPVDKFYGKNGKKFMWKFSNNLGNAQDIRFTRTKSGDKIYAFILGWPANGKLEIQSLAKKTKISTKGIKSIKLLGYDDKVEWKRSNESLTINLPDEKPCDHAFGFEIMINGKLLK